MTTSIVDTNVPLVANGACVGVSPECRLASIDFLERLLHKGNLAVDLGGLIEKEYRSQLGVGVPGVGSRFIQKFFAEAAHRVERVEIKVNSTGSSAKFKFDGTLKEFDISDRKFVILASETGYTIYNSTDSDWIEHGAELKRRGIKINLICGETFTNWFSK